MAEIVRPFLALLLAAMLAGCAHVAVQPSDSTTASASVTHGIQKTNATTSSHSSQLVKGLDPVGGVLQVSVAGHRTSEFTVAQDPNNSSRIVAAGMDWDSPDGTVQCTAFTSRDGGLTWHASPVLPGHVGTNEDTDPWVAFDEAGHAYLTCTEGGAGLLLGVSPDGGLTWDTARVVPSGGNPIKDAVGAFGDGEIYLCFQQDGKLQVMHSTDAGANWVQFGFGSLSAGCNGVQKTPTGAVVVLWQSGGQLEADNLNPAPPGVGVSYSLDNGATWATTTIQAELGAAPANMQSAPQAAAPSIAVSQVSGSVFVAAQQVQNAEVAGGVATSTHANVKLWRSTDQGRTFSELQVPKFVTEKCAACSEVHPTLAVDEKGRLAMQLVLVDEQDAFHEVWVALSDDDGSHWAARLSLATYDTTGQTGNYVPDPQAAIQQAQDLAQHPQDAPAAATARVDSFTWPLFHRDGGEYFGIVAAKDRILDLWVARDAAGRNTILGQPVRIINRE